MVVLYWLPVRAQALLQIREQLQQRVLAEVVVAGGCASGTVHMDASNFVQTCVNISKGSKVTLVDDVQVLHIITNGQWVNGTPQLSVQAGAPTIPNVNISGGSADIGPFNTAGKFNVLCTVHVGMNLVVNVT